MLPGTCRSSEPHSAPPTLVTALSSPKANPRYKLSSHLLHQAFEDGVTEAEVNEYTKIDPWFIAQVGPPACLGFAICTVYMLWLRGPPPNPPTL